jgi:NAD(P)-dependent dehydrogenase (short-subunit alcohol dehydrogenase family)
MSDNIEGKIVVITGASSGLGEATARLLSTKGAILVLGARRQDSLKALAETLASAGIAAALSHMKEQNTGHFDQCLIRGRTQGRSRVCRFTRRRSTPCCCPKVCGRK